MNEEISGYLKKPSRLRYSNRGATHIREDNGSLLKLFSDLD